MRLQKNTMRISIGFLTGSLLFGFLMMAFLAYPGAIQAQSESMTASPCAAGQLWLNVWIGTWCIDNIAQYIGIFYRFFIGTIGIFAVTMIMWGGMKWITASGNSEKISQAKDSITSAIIGVLIALISYILLNTINPMITDLKNPTITDITGIEFSDSGTFCEDLPPVDGKEWWEQIGLPGVQQIDCESEFAIKDVRADGQEVVRGLCHGRFCAGSNVCYYDRAGSDYLCLNPEKLCKDGDDSTGECRDRDATIAATNPEMGCSKRIDTAWKAFWLESGDECHYGPIFGPPDGWTAVDCGIPAAQDVCWYFEDGVKKPHECGGGAGEDRYCTGYLQRAVRGANSLCITKPDTDPNYVLYELWDGGKHCKTKKVPKPNDY